MNETSLGTELGAGGGCGRRDERGKEGTRFWAEGEWRGVGQRDWGWGGEGRGGEERGGAGVELSRPLEWWWGGGGLRVGGVGAWMRAVAINFVHSL